MTSSTTSETPVQLTLLPAPPVPLRFRLDEATRRRGLQHIAEIRALLERRNDTADLFSRNVHLERPAA